MENIIENIVKKAGHIDSQEWPAIGESSQVKQNIIENIVEKAEHINPQERPIGEMPSQAEYSEVLYDSANKPRHLSELFQA